MTERLLTDDEMAAYSERLELIGFGFSVAGDPPMGFDVTDGTVTYNYRYDGSASTAVELMDRVCAERGA